jgi:RNA-directed DNA polymerase
MNCGPEPTNRMGRPNQPPQPECCRQPGQVPSPKVGEGTERTAGGVHRDRHKPQTGVAPGLSDSASKRSTADGEGVISPEPNTSAPANGEGAFGLPGSKSVAGAEGVVRNLGGPTHSRRSNYGNQAGRDAQRQGACSEERSGFRSAHSSREQGPRGPDFGKGVDTATQPAKETSSVRTTDSSWQTSLRAIATKAAQQPTHRFGGLYRLLNEANLRECFYALRKDAAPGVDGVTFEEYEKNLDANLADLVRRLKKKSYHARLVRRKYIPKGQGKWRPLGIPTLEDKLVQMAVGQILSAIYEADFLACSYGYRPARSAHDAVRGLTDTLFYGRYEFVFEADIRGYFEHIQWDWLLRMLALRVQDGAILGLIRKWLRAGILEEDGRLVHPESGTPQGGVISPVLANVYLHYVLDLWFERRVKKHNKGGCELFRYADDFVVAFGWRHEAEAFEQELKRRLAQFGLEVAPDKTRIVRFGRRGGGHNGRFDFLGIEFRWEKSRAGRPIVKRRTSPKKLLGAVARFTEWIRQNRHGKLSELLDTVRAKYRGHAGYYGLIGNARSLHQYGQQTRRVLFKWLNRRSQRRSYTWPRFERLLRRFEVEMPKVMEGTRGLVRDLRRWTEERAERLGQVQLLGRHYRTGGCVSEVR